MYNKPKQSMASSPYAIPAFVNGDDVFNSKFIYMVRKLPSATEFTISTEVGRIDLICRNLNFPTSYSDILLIYNGLTTKELYRGTSLRVPSAMEVDKLISELNTVSSTERFLVNLRKDY